jgi:hypothetical protein
MECGKMRSLSRHQLAYREATKRQCRDAANESARTPNPAASQVVFEIGVTLAAALSIALVGNLLSVWLSG